MKHLHYFFCAVLCLSLFGACNDSSEPDVDLTSGLKADKMTVAVGETVTFTVISVTGEDITKDCTFCSNLNCFAGNSTSFSEAGVYTITAHHLNGDPAYPDGVLIPNDVKITVTDSSVSYVLSADKTTVAVGETVTFTIRTGMGEDITKDCTICSGSECFLGNTHSWAETGVYTIEAHYINGDPELPGGVPVPNTVEITVEDGSETYTISADKTTVKVGESLAFKVMSDSDKDVTKKFQIVEEGGNPYPYPTSMYLTAGPRTLYATNLKTPTIRTVNTVLITVNEASTNLDRSRFYQRTVMAEMTGTWCWACPQMAKGIAYLGSNLLYDRVLPIAVHEPSKSAQGGLDNQFNTLMSKFGTQLSNNIPSYVMNWNSGYTSVGYFGNVVADCPGMASDALESQALDASPAGIKIETTLEANRLLKAKIYITAKESTEYYLGVTLIEDNIIGYQNSGGDNYVHMNVGQGMLTTYDKIADPIGMIGVDEEKILDYEYTISEKYNTANCRLVVYVCKASSDKTAAPLGFLSSNAVNCPVGESVDYQYETID